MSTIAFYESLPNLKRFRDAMDPSNYHDVPDDWFIAVTDVRNSTQAIETGRYKEVNAIGAVSIMAMLNVTGSFNFPFVFGGDGCTICISPEYFRQTVAALKGVQEMGKSQFNLEIRAGIIPVGYLRENGHQIKIAKYQVSEYFSQATFLGGGISFAEETLKNDETGKQFQVESFDTPAGLDATGLECRWDEVRNTRGEVHSVIIESVHEDPAERFRLYQEIFAKISEIYGSEEEFAPITLSGLNLTLSNKKLAVERKIRTNGEDWKAITKYWIKLRIQWVFGKILMAFGIKTENVDWGIYKKDLAGNTDYRKFDDVLRLVLAGSETQRFLMQGFLETMFEKKKLVYGLHHAPSALITCVILNHQQGHVHLVDGSDGGYAMAAQKLKMRRQMLKL